MHPDYTWFGWFALVSINASRIPQIAFMLKSKQASGLSLSGTAAVQVGLASYLLYGLYQHDPVIITANIIGLVAQGVVLVLNYKWRDRDEEDLPDTSPYFSFIVCSMADLYPLGAGGPVADVREKEEQE